MKDIIIGIIGLCLFAAIVSVAGWLVPYDDSDNVTARKRSGVNVYHDVLTGCEYLGKLFGAVSPRLDANGKQICRKEVP